MASPQVGPLSTKLSFAKVAAMKVPNVAVTIPPSSDDKKSSDPKTRRKSSNNVNKSQPIASPIPIPVLPIEPVLVEKPLTQVTSSFEGLSLVKNTTVQGAAPRSAESGESLEDDASHLSNSSLKQQSFDTKSMASVTTFAMDEKESIRPDDSASVRAAEEDESIPRLSRNGTFQSDSDVIMPVFRTGIRSGGPNIPIAARRFHTLTSPPRFGDMPVNAILEPDVTIPSSSTLVADSESGEERRVRMPSLPVSPDEKLLDALASPKDRLPILQLEEKLLALINHPSLEFIDLPPQNSFARLLAHKLADYYSLAHHINEDGTSVRIFRTLNVPLPTPLAIVAKSIPVGSIHPPAAMKIMRRAGLGPRQLSAGGGSTAASSSAPSKTTSEAGVETNSDEGLMSPAEGTPGRDKSKLTREEREAQYRAARERIFGDFSENMTTESGSTGENSATMSRSSSSSGRRKTRKSKTPRDDTFEARSAFTATYGPMQMHSTSNPYSSQFSEPSYFGNPPTNFSPNMNYGTTPTQAYPGFDQNMQFNTNASANANYGANGPQAFTPQDMWSGMQSPTGSFYGYSQNSAGFQQPLPPLNNQFMQPSTTNMQQPANWINNQYPSQYQQSTTSLNPNANNWSAYPPYQYGQMPAPHFPNNGQYNNQHSQPGNFNRTGSLFNPQTRSFVPNNTSSRNNGRNNNRKKGPPPNMPSRPTSTPKIPGMDTTAKASNLTRGQDISNLSSPKPKEESLQQKYGAPANLPKKPPPSQVSSFGVDSTSNTALPTGPTIANGSGVPGGTTTA